MTLGELLLHKRTREMMDRLAKGEPPKVVAAALAGDLVSAHIAKTLGVEVQPASEGSVVNVKATRDENVVDAEFREIK